MQAILRKLDSATDNAYISRIDKQPYFYTKWHFHPELELSHIIESTGLRFVGDSIEPFTEGDLVLVGANLPHVWKNDAVYLEPDSNLCTYAQVIQFLPECFGSDFLKLKEMENIRALFEKAKRGLRIEGETKNKAIQILSKLMEVEKGVERITLLLSLLDLIAQSREVVYLSSENFLDSYHRFESTKINEVYEYTLSHYNQKILMEDVADIANMSVSNFCKFFKNRTRKTYVQFLTEVRISFACHLLIENKKSIQQIALDCGFQNISNFNRSFRLLKKQSPLTYRKTFFG
ncbi:MAG: AraC family transcriptional regulator [Saprospiraceae bacterium]|nr:AraC family transcriptional regulator [Saprospiraceae bacterium]